MNVSIIAIGDELLIGQVIDTNSAWMAQILNESGIEVYQVTSVHDQKEHILEAIDSAFGRVDVVLTTGGLGPTKDDITKHVLCEYFDTTLVADADVEKHIMQLYSHRADVLNRLTATQWMVPACATILPNRVGSAPLMVFAKGEKLLITMPGVPYEMKVAMQEQVMPYLNKKKYDNRLQIIQMLSDGEKCGCKLLEAFNITQPTLSHHMKMLTECGLVNARKEGKWQHYSLNCETLQGFKSFIEGLSCVKKKGCCCQ